MLATTDEFTSGSEWEQDFEDDDDLENWEDSIN